MATVLVERPSHRAPRRGDDPLSLFPMPAGVAGGRPTLEDTMTSAWEDLAAGHVTCCPVCGGDLNPVAAAFATPAGGCCRDCGTVVT
jgi:hypothetical protein